MTASRQTIKRATGRKMKYSVLTRRLVGSGISCGPSTDRYRFKQNWIVLTAYCMLVGFCYSGALPSLHQFVTSSRHPEDPSIQPGLGLSETWYSWIVSIISVGELIGAIATSYLLRLIYTKIYLLVNLVIVSLGGLLYAVGLYGWMLIIGRLLIGIFMGAVTVVLRVYIGETSSIVIATMPQEKRARSTLKYTAFFFTFTVCTLSVLSGPAVAAAVAQIPTLDQFRWPGYVAILLSLVLGVATLLWFRELPGDVRKKGGGGGGKFHLKNLPVPLYTLACLGAAFFVINWYFAVFETLLNPILADNFGFDVEYDSYAFVGTLMFFTAGMLLLYTLQRLHVDNRLNSLLALFIALCGSIIATDWQALRGDPCNQFTHIDRLNYSHLGWNNSDSGSSGISGSRLEGWPCGNDSQNFLCVAEESGINLDDCGLLNESTVLNASCVCEAFAAIPEFNCFWNPHSRVTGRDCQRCAKICRSHTRSLNLVQFLVGMSMVSLIVAIGRISITLIASDALAEESQTVFMGLLVSLGATARFTGPLWGNAAYLVVNRHVYIVMNILSGSTLLVLVPYVLLYRTMKPNTSQSSSASLRTTTSSSTVDSDLNSLLNHDDSIELARLIDEEEEGEEGEGKSEVSISLHNGGLCVIKGNGALEKEEEENEEKEEEEKEETWIVNDRQSESDKAQLLASHT